MQSNSDSIFVQIASYRDTDLPRTIASALDNADQPERLTFGICWQFDDLTYTDLDRYINDSRFRISQHYFEDSQGCCWARNRTNQLYQDEDYTLQIDAHTRFCEKWDTKYLDMFRKIDSDKPLLTTYPPPFVTENGKDRLFEDRGIQRLKLNRLRKNLTTSLGGELVETTDYCTPSHYIGAGQIFTIGHFCKEVEYDPNLYFEGEEISLAVRAFTHGYDMFCPNENLIWHRYNHTMPTHWTDHGESQQVVAIDRIFEMLTGDHQKLGKYGLGSVRTLSEYEQMIGIVFKDRQNRAKIPTYFQQDIELDLTEVEDREDYAYWIFTLNSIDEEEIYRFDIFDKRILRKQVKKIRVEAQLEDKPMTYMVWPYVVEVGYLSRIRRNL